MELLYISIIIGLLCLVVFLSLHIASTKKRINSIHSSIKQILEGQNKLQIFSDKKDEIGQLVFEINRLTDLYGTVQERYEKEQITKKQLISNLSHDVRTPLVSVIGYLEAIVQNRIAENQKDDYILTAYNKSKQLKEQINQLFEFVQSDANEIKLCMEKVDICETTKQILIDFLPTIEQENMELETDIPDDELNAWVDKASFIRITQNLIKNAMLHGEKGKYLGVFVKEEKESIYIDIADKGHGIKKEDEPYIFDRLYKADGARTRGGGIGLAIAKELANKMNGNIEILRSIPNDTVFRVTFTRLK